MVLDLSERDDVAMDVRLSNPPHDLLVSCKAAIWQDHIFDVPATTSSVCKKSTFDSWKERSQLPHVGLTDEPRCAIVGFSPHANVVWSRCQAIICQYMYTKGGSELT